MKPYTGTVISNKMSGTIVVERTIVRHHPLYKKIMRRQQRLKAHTDKLVAIGDVVEIVSCRPIAKGVHFRVHTL